MCLHSTRSVATLALFASTVLATLASWRFSIALTTSSFWPRMTMRSPSSILQFGMLVKPRRDFSNALRFSETRSVTRPNGSSRASSTALGKPRISTKCRHAQATNTTWASSSMLSLHVELGLPNLLACAIWNNGSTSIASRVSPSLLARVRCAEDEIADLKARLKRRSAELSEATTSLQSMAGMPHEIEELKHRVLTLQDEAAVAAAKIADAEAGAATQRDESNALLERLLAEQRRKPMRSRTRT